MALQATERRAQEQRRLAASTVVASRGAWRLVDQSALDSTSPQYLARVLPLLIAAQISAARGADAYVGAALSEQDLESDPLGEVRPQSLAGFASDGRSLATLLAFPVIRAKSLIGGGAPVDQAMGSARNLLDMIVQTQVADAGRVAEGVSIAARPSTGWVRMVTPPSCPRCVVLAGKFYRWNSGFQRHPFCDCRHIPSSENVAGSLETDPRQLFEQGQIRGLSKADSLAISEGADINRVVNAHRGMFTADDGRKFTHALAGRRGIPSRRIRPEQIFRDAVSRDDAVRLLRLHGYLG